MPPSERAVDVIATGVPSPSLWQRIASVPWLRKVFHLLSGLYSMYMILQYDRPWPLYQAIAWLAFWTLVEWWRLSNHRFNRSVFRTFRPFFRGEERRRPVNVWFCAAAVLVTAFVHDPTLAAACFIGWTFGDPTAEVVGRTVRSPRLGLGRKTVAGLVSCFTVTFVAYLLFFGLIEGGMWWWLSLAGALATTMAEAGSERISDNLTIPLACALALSFFS